MAYEKINAEVVKGADGTFNTIDVKFEYDEPRGDKYGNQDWGVQDEKLLRCSATLLIALESLGVKKGSTVKLSKTSVETKNGIIHPWVVNGKPASDYKVGDAIFAKNTQASAVSSVSGNLDYLETVIVQLQSAIDTLKSQQQTAPAPQVDSSTVELEDLPF